MAVTRDQLIDIGFKPTKKSKVLSNRKYDTLIYPLNKTDYIYTGYNNFNKNIDFKRLWKTFYDPESEETYTYPIDKMGELSLTIVKDIIKQAEQQSKVKEEYYQSKVKEK